VAKGENRQQRRLSKSVFSQIFSSLSISQTGTDIVNPYSENVHDIDENNIPEYHADPMVEGGLIAVG